MIIDLDRLSREIRLSDKGSVRRGIKNVCRPVCQSVSLDQSDFTLTNCGSLEITNKIYISVVAEVVSYHVLVNMSSLVRHVDVENYDTFARASLAFTYDNFICMSAVNNTSIVLHNISDYYCKNCYCQWNVTKHPSLRIKIKIYFTRSYLGFSFAIFLFSFLITLCIIEEILISIYYIIFTNFAF